MARPRRIPIRLRPHLAALARAGGRALKLAGVSPAGMLDRLSRLARGDRVRLAARGQPYGTDPRQRLDLWAPNDERSAPWPVVVFFYGGGWDSGSREDYGFVGRALAARGYLAVVADYRLAPHVRFPAFIEDAAAAIAWTAAHAPTFGGDPARIAVMGHSAGAHIAALATLDPQYLANAGAPGAVKALVSLSGPHDFDPMRYPATRVAFEGWPTAIETMPVHHVHRAAPPTLLIHGSADTIVRARNSQSLARALERSGVPVTLSIHRGAQHRDTIKPFSPLFRDEWPVLDEVDSFLRDVWKDPR